MSAPARKIRSTYSQCPFQIRMHDQAGLISTGTAFFYAFNDEWFLITNWHNLSGKHFLKKEPLTPGRLPTHIEVNLSSYGASNIELPEGCFTTIAQRVEIYQDFAPIWFEHPTLGSQCDVVALPFARPSHCPENMHNAANLIGSTRIPIRPGSTVYAIGFPESLSVGFGLPLWKSGYIASEPEYAINIGGEPAPSGGNTGGTILPAFFIDSETRKGMSGSPVFASYSGTWDMTDPYRYFDPQTPEFWNRNDIALGAHAIEFLGCYSGRVGTKKEDGAALGLCWPEHVIKEICQAKSIGKNPHVQ